MRLLVSPLNSAKYTGTVSKVAILLFCMLLSAHDNKAEAVTDSLQWGASTVVAAGSGDFTPSYIASNRYGTLTQAGSAFEAAWLKMTPDTHKRFSYGFGVQAWAGTGSAVDYARYDPDLKQWEANGQKPAYVWLQELYGELRYRSLFLELGMRDYTRSLFSNATSSGDIVLGMNARGIPQLRAGFYDFVDIPLTQGWVQIQGEIAYGKFADNKWIENHFNRYSSFMTTGVWFHYKRMYLRSNPDKPLSVTFGMQHAVQFGGTQYNYSGGEPTSTYKNKVAFKDFFDVFLPNYGGGHVQGDMDYINGNHLGSWDLQVRYRLPAGQNITFYLQAPWEDGSGIGKLNGWDGVWGLRYESAEPLSWLTAASVEYIDFSNQSGPMHWAPGDFPDTPIHGEATGSDDYYNNYFYNGWANNGMALGSPLVKSIIYNTDGYLRFTDNRIRGFHIGLEGKPAQSWSWRMLTGYTRSLGTPYMPRLKKARNYSLMLEASHSFSRVKGLKATAQAGMDAGSIFGHRYGVSVALSYTGAFSLKKHNSK